MDTNYFWQVTIFISLGTLAIRGSFMFLSGKIVISERVKEDREMVLWLFIYPFYALFMRVVTAFAMINEVVRRGHEESSMAPWWVLKRGKRF